MDSLVDRLRDDVLSGRYPPGSYLPPERELAAGYAVTRTSLKHAIVRLAQAGLLETRHGVGTRVRDYERLGGPELLPMLVHTAGPAWMREIFEVRREVGAQVAAKAAEHGTSEHRDRLRELAALLRDAGDADAAQLTECEIHRVIAGATGNRVYGFLVNSLLNAYLKVRERFTHAFADPAAAADRIAPLVGALCAGDPARARGAAEAYFAETEAIMLKGPERSG
ncbi:FadR/GntR family transcriptional regulator [Actinomadura livida]|uniref:DNA-binding FadR family transcriptional regulator n=1 Tax=Actinomadura livida TaxID=79909 RepID=A0A7W7IFH3_9ACTN|nr:MULTISPECIES: GntR family transcriptional regulator [Actinomadura]MBB4776158.1 DNA-binding FadR family transcriptional regulator [Actinomadura catellatispora]GGU15056.1 putative HTH-type transcriptional regulator [Actinomadura livida]